MISLSIGDDYKIRRLIFYLNSKMILQNIINNAPVNL